MDKLDNNNEDYLLNPKEFSKSNVLIGSKYRANITELKITALSLSRIKIDDKDNVYAELKASELKNYLNLSKSYFYTALNNTAEKMTGRTIGFSNPETQEFDYIAVITRATYKKGLLTIKFNNDLKSYILNIKSNFTKLSLPILMSLDNAYAFRLYELLKSKEYKGQYVSIGISELRFSLGVANAELDKVKNALRGKKTPDYDKAYELSPEKVADDFRHLHADVIKPAVEEINKKTEINLEYRIDKNGKGGKAYQITFKVTQKDHEKIEDQIIVEDTSNNISENDKEEFIELLMDNMIEERLKYRDYLAIAEAAKYDALVVRRAYKAMKASRTPITNVTGFLLKAIENGYDVVAKKNTLKNDFNSFKQTSFADFQMTEDEFEKSILSN